MPRSLTVAVGLIAAAAVAVPVLASTRSAGGESIAAAAPLPVGEIVTAKAPARAGVQFWKVDVRAADMLVLDFGWVDGPLNDTGVCLLPAGTTDATLAATHCLSTVPDLHWAAGRGEVTFVPQTTGTYYVAAGLADCLRGAAPDAVKPCASEAVPAIAYRIGAEILHFTAVHIVVPRNAVAHRPIRVSGSVVGAADGGVGGTITAHGFKGRTVRATLATGGTFAVTIAGLPHGRYRLRLEYPGDPSHRPSAGIVMVSVR